MQARRRMTASLDKSNKFSSQAVLSAPTYVQAILDGPWHEKRSEQAPLLCCHPRGTNRAESGMRAYPGQAPAEDVIAGRVFVASHKATPMKLNDHRKPVIVGRISARDIPGVFTPCHGGCSSGSFRAVCCGPFWCLRLGRVPIHSLPNSSLLELADTSRLPALATSE